MTNPIEKRVSDGAVTRSIEHLMREKYCSPEWALLMNVGNATGFNNQGWADAVAMSLYPSRGLAIHGFEFKASRSDWVKELKSPEKAEKVAKYCDHWWLVARAGIVREDEIPLAWGHYEWQDATLKLVKPAATHLPTPLDRDFVAAMLRRVAKADESLIGRLVDKRIQDYRKERASMMEHERQTARGEYGKIHDSVKEIKESTGIDLLSYKAPKEFANAINFVLKSKLFQSYAGIEALVESAESFAANLREQAKASGIELSEIDRRKAPRIGGRKR